MPLKINSPQTVYIKFTAEMPRKFCLFNKAGELYYFRYLDGKTPRIKFNIVEPDEYSGNTPFDVVKTTAIETPETYPKLPPAERDRWKDLKFVYNPNLKGTPARIFSDSGVVEHSPEYYEYPKPIRLFLDLHESGHLLYKTEEYCDLWALINYLRMGYNRSMAYYTLYHILRRTSANLDRLNFLLSQIQITQNGTI